MDVTEARQERKPQTEVTAKIPKKLSNIVEKLYKLAKKTCAGATKQDVYYQIALDLEKKYNLN